MQGISDMSSYNPIGNKQLVLTPIANSLLVDRMLEDCSDLIDPQYKRWFAGKFYKLSVELIQRAASEARHDTKNSPQRLFTHIINKMVRQYT